MVQYLGVWCISIYYTFYDKLGVSYRNYMNDTKDRISTLLIVNHYF